MKKYRERLEIVYDILSVINDGVKKTHVMYKANLSYKLLTRYLDELLTADLVVLKENALYCLTERGDEFLSRCKDYFSLREQVESSIEEMNDEEAALKQLLSERIVIDS